MILVVRGRSGGILDVWKVKLARFGGGLMWIVTAQEQARMP